MRKFPVLKQHVTDVYRGVEVKLRPFLISAIVGGEWSGLRFALFTPGGKKSRVLIGYEAGWTPERVWTLWRKDFDGN
jgi:hypothetical protein